MIDQHSQQTIANFRDFMFTRGVHVLIELTDQGLYVVSVPRVRVSSTDYGERPYNAAPYMPLDTGSLGLRAAKTPHQAQIELILRLAGRWLVMPGADDEIPAPRFLPDISGFGKIRSREQLYRDMIAKLARAIYNEEGWDRQSVKELLGMLDEMGKDLPPSDQVPETLSDADVFAALDSTLEEAGL